MTKNKGRIAAFFQQAVSNFENKSTPLSWYVLTFFAAVSMRNMLEIFSTKCPVGNLQHVFYHYYISWILLALGIILLLQIMTGEKGDTAARIVLPLFLILLMAPAIDLMISGGKGFKIDYLYSKDDLITCFFTFFGPLGEKGVSIGMRIEISIVLIITFAYCRLKRLSRLKSLATSFLLYCLIFLWGASPWFLLQYYKLLNIYSAIKAYNSYSVSNHNSFFLVWIFIAIIWILWRSKPHLVKILAGNIRPYRIAHYLLMIIIGLVVGRFDVRQLVAGSWIFHLLFMTISLVLACVFSIITNDIQDLEIDRVTNKRRPLVRGVIDQATYSKAAWFALGLMVVYSHAVNFSTMFFFLVFVANYYVYSMPPLKLKRITFFSKLVISSNSLLMMLTGYLFTGKDLYSFPLILALYVLGAFTPAVNFIDLKDYEGDRKAGIKTLPVVMGLKPAKRLIGVFFVFAHLGTYVVIKNVMAIAPLALLGVFQFYLINREDYQERYVFIIHLASLVFLAGYLLFAPGVLAGGGG